jgi:hypothetical protein
VGRVTGALTSGDKDKPVGRSDLHVEVQGSEITAPLGLWPKLPGDTETSTFVFAANFRLSDKNAKS